MMAEPEQNSETGKAVAHDMSCVLYTACVGRNEWVMPMDGRRLAVAGAAQPQPVHCNCQADLRSDSDLANEQCGGHKLILKQRRSFLLTRLSISATNIEISTIQSIQITVNRPQPSFAHIHTTTTRRHLGPLSQ